MNEGRFVLRDWEFSIQETTNSTEVNSNVLGLRWERTSDTLSICPDPLPYGCLEGKITKRNLLSVANRVFDPIGFTSPVTLYPKLLLQSTWKEKLSWDAELSTEVKFKFLKWVECLPYLGLIKIPRYFQGYVGSQRGVSIHTFCDASKYAYAAVSFIRIETSEGVNVQLLQSKSRVAPVKEISIPRLELIAATIGTRLARSIMNSQAFGQVELVFWTDSSTVLAWLNRDEQWSVFVRNRVSEILGFSNKDQWRHVSGINNPADLPSRGCSSKILVQSQWWEGPDWLRQPTHTWPNGVLSCDEKEIGSEKRAITLVSITKDHNSDWYYKYFSRYSRIIRLIGWINRFHLNCRYPNNKIKGELNFKEVADAELILLRLIQSECFTGENYTRIECLNPYLDSDGLIRLKTKLFFRDDNKYFRLPIVLPRKHVVVYRLIMEEHVKNCHAGVLMLLSILRERYWVIGGRQTIRSVISKCVNCKRFTVKHLESAPAPLPLSRVDGTAAFDVVGVDLAGPLYVKGNVKVWVVLFTCGIYRAVHLELVSTLSTEGFLQSLRRFIARRGRPSIVYSDNGTNFVGSENAFCKIDWDLVGTYSTSRKIDWRFNPPSGSWWGGWWERLIGILKRLLRRILGRSCLNYEELVTVLCDCESVINSRPLSYVYESDGELAVLTPSMFIQDIKEIGIPDCDLIESKDFGKRAAYRQKLREHLRNRFRAEYLGQLKHRAFKRGQDYPIKVGEIVLIGDDNHKRIDWPLARVKKIIAGADGVIRLVKLDTSSGRLTRPIQRVFPLEVGDDVPSSLTQSGGGPKDSIASGSMDTPPNMTNKTRSGRVVNLPSRYK